MKRMLGDELGGYPVENEAKLTSSEKRRKTARRVGEKKRGDGRVAGITSERRHFLSVWHE